MSSKNQPYIDNESSGVQHCCEVEHPVQLMTGATRPGECAQRCRCCQPDTIYHSTDSGRAVRPIQQGVVEILGILYTKYDAERACTTIIRYSNSNTTHTEPHYDNGWGHTLGNVQADTIVPDVTFTMTLYRYHWPFAAKSRNAG